MIQCRINISKYDGKVKVYGLDFICGKRYIKRVKGIKTSYSEIKEISDKINSGNLSIYHIDDIIDDILG